MSKEPTRLEKVFLALEQMVQDADDAIQNVRSVRDQLRSVLETPMSQEDVQAINEECGLDLAVGSTPREALYAVVLRKKEEGDADAIEAAERYGIREQI